jgi:uncharacterized protein (TIGR02270 family)
LSDVKQKPSDSSACPQNILAGSHDRRPIVSVVVRQYVEDAGILYTQRTELVRASHAQMLHIKRFDERLAAHLDGLAIAGEHAVPMLEATLDSPSSNALFVATVCAIEAGSREWFDRLIAVAEAIPDVQQGMRGALGWLEPSILRGIVVDLLASAHALRRAMGIAASAMHRVDPGIIVMRRFEDPNPLVRARAFRTGAEVGKRELVSRFATGIADPDATCQFWAAWSAVLLGDRERAFGFLTALAASDGPHQARAFDLALLAMSAQQGHEFLRHRAADPNNLRMVIRGAGLVGDPTYVPWLISHMADDKLARLAGESFSLITGLDLAWLDLERRPPENLVTGPNDDPEDENVDEDPDDGLPWPDQALIERWWQQHGARFTVGTRHFMGAPLNHATCISTLKEGYQRQRIAAAYHLCLINPGTPLFEWRAPAWRQQRELAQM